MRFRIGLLTGFAAGYYLGAKAGRPRYEQMKRWLHEAQDSELVQSAADKAKEAAHVATDKAKEVVDIRHQDDEPVAERIDLFVAPGTTAAL
jgi:hypothetical protein